MRFLTTVVLLTAVIASPAFARHQARMPHAGSGVRAFGQSFGPIAAADRAAIVVGLDGKVIGRDPDPRIRAEMLREYGRHD